MVGIAQQTLGSLVSYQVTVDWHVLCISVKTKGTTAENSKTH